MIDNDSVKSITICTMHSFCLMLLRKYSENPNFTIYDDDDSLSIIKQLTKKHSSDKDKDNDKISANSIQKTISLIKRENLLTKTTDISLINDEVLKLSFHYVKSFQSYLIQNNAKDFDDLIIDAAKLLQVTELKHKITRKYQHVLVDEWQDLDSSQFNLFRLLTDRSNSNSGQFSEGSSSSSSSPSSFVVGDANQVIYSWRGVYADNMIKYKDLFNDCGDFKLVDNYRSSLNIQYASNSILDKSSPASASALSSPSQYSRPNQSENVNIVQTYSDVHQASYIAKLIKELQQYKNVSRHQISILFRRRSDTFPIETCILLYCIVLYCIYYHIIYVIFNPIQHAK